MSSFPKFRLLLATAALTLTTATATLAQTAPQKIGYTNVDYVLSQMPESKQIESQLKDYSTQLENQLKAKYQEYQTKGEAYQKGAATMAEPVRADKEKELQSLQQSIQEFQRNAEASVQQKQQALLKPVLDKLQKNIDAVADENGYAYVLNSDAGYGTTPILLHGPKDGDISDLVLKKMGITPGAAPAAAPTAAKPAAPAATPAATSTKTKTKSKK
ncbi:OmpH family outer membrane protein [Hymenobacter lutimineralis]|uniref:OmpH family outer membrane protein n=1 Tax=Hymenobacter lutimineralis TaxID=2606448 RepID=A0A5D6VB38_9BACT|nr:OmpH family outer membrane protein [Hymenobacter lutimineralis]TYZ12465.1 OmpH family outer membrane protein [Hymenobacter lutimineralis]